MQPRLLFIVPALLLSVTCQPAFAKKVKSQDSNKGYYELKSEPSDVDDPWESFNHPIFDFNVAFDRHVFKPIIELYDNVPHGIRHSISNFLNNLSEPLNAVHGILQLNPKVTFTSVWRFILNSTFGLGGINDFAKENAGLRPMEQNLGKTFGHWGVPTGPYIVLPIIGPSSARDTTGKAGDWFADPVGYVDTTWDEVGRTVADGIDTRDTKAAVVEHLYYDSLDPYTATRSAFRQHETFEGNSQE